MTPAPYNAPREMLNSAGLLTWELDWCLECGQHPDFCTRCEDCDECAPPRQHYTDLALCAKHRRVV